MVISLLTPYCSLLRSTDKQNGRQNVINGVWLHLHVDHDNWLTVHFLQYPVRVCVDQYRYFSYCDA